MGESLGEALPREIERVNYLIKLYESVPNGMIAALMMKNDVERARKAIAEEDLLMMISVYQDLKTYKE